MIGIGLDAVTEDLFRRIRTDVPAGGAGLSWAKYWEVVNDAREIFGPWKVNCHTLVGLGETDRDLIDIFTRLRDREIFSYLFCFNPEPDSRMADHPKSPLRRWRRIQLAKHLIETDGFGADQFDFDADDNLTVLDGDTDVVERSVESGIPFMTNGCPGAGGEPGCTRPYGSYRPSEPIRDFPFLPERRRPRRYPFRPRSSRADELKEKPTMRIVVPHQAGTGPRRGARAQRRRDRRRPGVPEVRPLRVGRPGARGGPAGEGGRRRRGHRRRLRRPRRRAQPLHRAGQGRRPGREPDRPGRGLDRQPHPGGGAGRRGSAGQEVDLVLAGVQAVDDLDGQLPALLGADARLAPRRRRHLASRARTTPSRSARSSAAASRPGSR